MNSWEYVKNLGAGWNLGNTLDARSEGGDSPFDQEQAWGNPVTTEPMIKAVKAAGFDLLRVPVSWCKQLGPAPDYVVKPDFIARVNEVVDYGIDNNMTVILNLHHEDWHFPSEENFPKAAEILKKLWTQIAAHFSGYGMNLIFEAMNEPRKKGTPVEWNDGDEEGRKVVMKLNQVFADTIRAAGGNNADRMLMVPSYAASCHEGAVSDFIMPMGENLIMSLHAYVPYPFALSGDHSINTWSKDQEPEIDELFARIDKYFLSKGIPVIMGECGARNKRENHADRAEWAKYYTGKARQYGVPCVWWDNGELQGPDKSEVFGIFDRNNLSWPYPEIVDAFLGRD